MQTKSAKLTSSQIAASAKRAGYTMYAIVELGSEDYYGWLKPNAHPDRAFTMIEAETGRISNFGFADAIRDLDD